MADKREAVHGRRKAETLVAGDVAAQPVAPAAPIAKSVGGWGETPSGAAVAHGRRADRGDDAPVAQHLRQKHKFDGTAAQLVADETGGDRKAMLSSVAAAPRSQGVFLRCTALQRSGPAQHKQNHVTTPDIVCVQDGKSKRCKSWTTPRR